MRTPFRSPVPLALLLTCALTILTLPISGHNIARESGAGRVPMFHDWTMRHILTPRYGPMSAMLAAQRDARAQFTWQRRFGSGRPGRWPRLPSSARPRNEGIQRDWSIYLGTAGTAPNMYPAKFSFDVNAAPDCTNDFVVFPIAANGSTNQPNIVAFNHLYSGTGPTGSCNRTPSASDTGVAAEVYWSYNVSTLGGAVTTSPVLSFDSTGATTGAKVAFVESAAGAADFHVLAWKAGDGVDASNLQSVGIGSQGHIVSAQPSPSGAGKNYAVGDTGTISGGAPPLATYKITAVGGGGGVKKGGVMITSPGSGYTEGATGVATTATTGNGSGLKVNITVTPPTLKTINSFMATAPVPGSGTATALTLGSSSDTLSSPFPDYQDDVVYVGNDAGQLYRIKDVFCVGADGTNPDCKSASPAPSIDTTWGSGTGFVQVCSGMLTGPAVDFVTLDVYVGCSDGKLYRVTQQGAVNSIPVGDGSTYGGIVDPPEVDSIDGFVYAVSGSGSASSGASGVLVQATADLSSSVAVPIGAGGQCNIHDATPSNAFFTSPTTAGALLYVGGVSGSVGQPCSLTSMTTGTNTEVYGVAFNADGTLNSGTPAGFPVAAGPGYEFAPLQEFFNATTGIDWLFLGALKNRQNDIRSVQITNGLPTCCTASAEEGIGISGMVVDNDSSLGQASSIYFNALRENATCTNTTDTAQTGGCAVKLTQATLQ